MGTLYPWGDGQVQGGEPTWKAREEGAGAGQAAQVSSVGSVIIQLRGANRP